MKKAPALVASPFEIVADLRPLLPTIIISTPVYVDPIRPGEDLSAHDQRIAILFDEDEDERVIDVLIAILYRSARAFTRIAAVHEHKGLMIVWGCGYTAEDKAVISAAADATVLRGDSWPVEIRHQFIDAGAGGFSIPNFDVAQLHQLFDLGKTPDPPGPPGPPGVISERDIIAVLDLYKDTTLTLRRDRGSRER